MDARRWPRMILRSIIGFGLAAALSACGGASPAPVERAAVAVPVTVAGATFMADVMPGPTGRMISGGRAVPVNGLQVAVTRQGAALGNDEGRLAKQAADAACTGQGMTFNANVHGRYAGAGVWRFEGACT